MKDEDIQLCKWVVVDVFNEPMCYIDIISDTNVKSALRLIAYIKLIYLGSVSINDCKFLGTQPLYENPIKDIYSFINKLVIADRITHGRSLNA